MTTAITTVQEGKDKLREIEQWAIEHFHNSREAFDRAMLGLYQINEEKLWEYAEDEDGVMLRDYKGGGSFETYLGWFCTRHGVSRSSVQQHLKTVRTWAVLGRSVDQLMDIGIRRAGPIQKIVNIDGRSGEIKLPPEEVIQQLPLPLIPLEDREEEALERINRKIDEILFDPPEPLTNQDVRKAFTIDIDEDAEEVYFFEDADGNIWYTWETGDNMGDGVLISGEITEHLPEVVVEKVIKRLRVMRRE